LQKLETLAETCESIDFVINWCESQQRKSGKIQIPLGVLDRWMKTGVPAPKPNKLGVSIVALREKYNELATEYQELLQTSEQEERKCARSVVLFPLSTIQKNRSTR
jgi:hypothetical protein